MTLVLTGENENIDKKSDISNTENEHMIDVRIDEATGDMLNSDKNEAMVVTELPSQKRERVNLPSKCCELLQKIKNIYI